MGRRPVPWVLFVVPRKRGPLMSMAVVSMRFPPAMLVEIRRLARKIAPQEGRDLSWQRLVRELVSARLAQEGPPQSPATPEAWPQAPGGQDDASC